MSANRSQRRKAPPTPTKRYAIKSATVSAVVVGVMGTSLVAIPTADAVPPSQGCGLDQATAVQSALAQLPPEPQTGRDWYSRPLYSSYDPCADLSAVVVTIQGATGSSPEQALIFHRGTYLGTGTSKAYGFTTLDTADSANDTVVLRYRSGQSCTACGDGIVTTVRYHWDGTKVQMLDPPPPG